MKELSLGTKKLLINGTLGVLALINGIINTIDGKELMSNSINVSSIVYISIAIGIWRYTAANKDDEMSRMNELKAKASIVNKLWIFAFVMCFVGNRYNMVDLLVGYILICESIEFRRLEKYGE